jgi:3-dehydroquinate dehydratase / shikimate dehydrogenase
MADLCITVGAPTLAELRRRRDRAAKDADLVELRLDMVEDPDPVGALAGRSGPVIVTCRASWEGGHFRGSEEDRLRILEQAWRAGAEFVDVEFEARHSAPWIAATIGERLILSFHDFDRVPADLVARHWQLLAARPAVAKLAVTAARLGDLVQLLGLPRPESSRQQVILAMGPSGLPTRIVPDRFGSAWTYAGDDYAPGMLPADRLRHEFRFGRATPAAALYGIVARPSGHSVSPAMHNAAFDAAGIDAVYLPLEAESANDFLQFRDAIGLSGASVTLPFKVDLLPHCEPDDESKAAGAVNTLIRRDGRWLGRNTDIAGVLAPLANRMRLEGRRVTILGAGGAARGTALAFASAGARITLCARRREQASAAAGDLVAAIAPFPPEAGSWDLLVNATPVGMYPKVDETPLPGARFDGQLVYDLIYNPPETRLLREARAAGCDTLGGLPMLVAQAEAQFMLWTGTAPAPGVMLKAAGERLQQLVAPTPLAS